VALALVGWCYLGLNALVNAHNTRYFAAIVPAFLACLLVDALARGEPEPLPTTADGVR
jgi:hypothetical protein